jgi:membrane associated rhomboid family serine protease
MRRCLPVLRIIRGTGKKMPMTRMNDLKPQIEKDEAFATGEESWVEVGRYPALHEAYDHGLVILAMGEACRVTEAETPGQYILESELHPIAKISAELHAYGRELNAISSSVPASNDWARHSPGWGFCGAWVITLMAVFYWQGQDPTLVDRAASSSVGLISRGEWWRPFTGLFLHADLGHLLGNLVGGVIFAALVARMLGPILGWTLILASGALGNIITSALTYPQSFNSIGASTAVFAALGILSGIGIAETLRERARLPWLRILAPVFAGIILLGWLGGGHDPHTDVIGHVFGFSSGLAAGAAAGALEAKRTPLPA